MSESDPTPQFTDKQYAETLVKLEYVREKKQPPGDKQVYRVFELALEIVGRTEPPAADREALRWLVAECQKLLAPPK